MALVLAVVGVKMLTASWLKEILGASFNFYVLGFVLGILAVGVGGSVLAGRRGRDATAPKLAAYTLAAPPVYAGLAATARRMDAWRQGCESLPR